MLDQKLPVPSNISLHAKEIYEEVMESLSGKTNPRTGKTYTGEERGRIAWSAVKKKYKKSGNRWVKK